ncbi:hypothetical protein ALQ73_04899 [Pseudomonas savastanoi pv. glycinea]|uniref:Uncharacterized protein n=1 Tax=Pseudomonas savastanoi pv. glycinea TaxID=318 RepID=A0A3M3GKI6_PSESG|nr:hypothetical protein ALQ73_04899 [Pseudomonas savastanoi pv. glycinea]
MIASLSSWAIDGSTLNVLLIAVNLNDFAEAAANKRQKVPDLAELKRHLKTSKCPKFIETNRNVCSSWDIDAADKPKTVRCWIFQAA